MCMCVCAQSTVLNLSVGEYAQMVGGRVLMHQDEKVQTAFIPVQETTMLKECVVVDRTGLSTDMHCVMDG